MTFLKMLRAPRSYAFGRDASIASSVFKRTCHISNSCVLEIAVMYEEQHFSGSNDCSESIYCGYETSESRERRERCWPQLGFVEKFSRLYAVVK